MVNVMLADGFTTSGVAYATTTCPRTSALSRTTDGGKSWRQISFIDWATAGYYKVSSLYLVSGSPNEWRVALEPSTYTYTSYWHTQNSGTTYERFYSYANPTMPNRLDGLDIKGADKDVFFILNKAQGRYWRSTDGGKSFPRIVSLKGQRDANHNLLGSDRQATSGIIDETSLYAVHYDGKVRYSENLGRSWTEPEESIIPALTAAARVTKGDLHYVENLSTGEKYVSTDGGKNYLKKMDTGGLGLGSSSYDSNYATNGFFYHTVTAGANGGVWKTELDPDTVESLEWERVDNIGPTNPATSAAVDLGSKISQYGGVMYVIVDNDGTGTSGIWRSTNYSNDIRGVYPPHFELVGGLPAGEQATRLTMTSSPVPTMYVRMNDYASADTYDSQFQVWSDTLNKSTGQLAPEDGAFNAGVSLNTQDLTMTAILSWEAKTGATSYEYEIARDEEFSSIVARGYTTGQEARVGSHVTGTTYYWRVRVAADGPAAGYNPIGAPLISPYSGTRSYTVGSAYAVKFESKSPVVGAASVSIQPTFTWTPFAGALNYEIMVSEDKEFAILEWSHTVTDTFYMTEEIEKLAYDTTYYWKVRGVTGPVPAVKGREKGAAPGGPWATGVFTTMAEPVEEEPAVITITEPAAPPVVKVVEVPVPQPTPIPSYLLWTIIFVGAVLVIALIVLIVRTRRVT